MPLHHRLVVSGVVPAGAPGPATEGHIAIYECETLALVPPRRPVEFRIHASMDVASPIIGTVTNGSVLLTIERCRVGSLTWLRIIAPVEGFVIYTLHPRMVEYVPDEAKIRRSPFRVRIAHVKSRGERIEYARLLLAARPDVVPDQCRVLYHQTNEAAAAEILKPGAKMLRGSQGAVGGGIYFACSAAETHCKAHHHGVILRCVVYVGRVHETSDTTDRSFWALLKLGFDSVLKTGFQTGHEYVVYNSDQVLSLRRE